MANTVTTANNAQSVGTGSNVGSDKFPTKTTLTAGTTAAVIEARVVNGDGVRQDERQGLEIWWAVSTLSVAAAAAPALLRQSAKKMSLVPGPAPLDDKAKMSDLFSCIGTYLYIWCEIPNMGVAAALSIYVVEP